MRMILTFVFLAALASPAVAVDCYQDLEKGDTMGKVQGLCGDPERRKNLGSEMDVRDEKQGQAKTLTIEHSRTENLWIYENDKKVYLRFVNGELIEKSLKDE